MENNSPWNIPVENTTLSICCNGNNTALIRIYMGTTLIGLVHSIKFEADMNKVYPVIEIKFADLTAYSALSGTLKNAEKRNNDVSKLIKNIFPFAKVLIGDKEIQ